MVKKRRAVKAANYGSPMKCFDVTTSATDKVMKGIDAKSFEDAARQVAGWSEHSKKGTVITVADRKGNTRSYEVIRKGAVRDVTGDTHEARQAMGASSTVRRRSRVTAAERPITPADRKRCIDFVARDYGVTKKQAAEWVKEYSDDRIRTLLGIESDQAKKAFIYDSTRVKRKTIVRASASAKRRAIKAASGEKRWLSTELPKDMAWKFKVWLRDNGIKFEPSEAGNLIHFEVFMDRDEAQRANDFIDSIDNGVSASAAPKRRRAIKAAKIEDWGDGPVKVFWKSGKWSIIVDGYGLGITDGWSVERPIIYTHKNPPTVAYDGTAVSVPPYVKRKFEELVQKGVLKNRSDLYESGEWDTYFNASSDPKRKFTVKASCGGKKPVKADYRRYEDPYKLEQMLEEAEARLAEDPDDVDLRIWVYELRDRVNFAWQDDEYDAENADRFDDDVFGKSAVKCTEKTDTFVIYNHGNFVSSGGYDALRGGIYEIVSVDEDAKKACIDYCNSFGDPVIEETATAQEVADTTTEVIAAEYSDAWDAEEFAVYIGDHHNGVNIEIFDKALAAVNAATDVEIEKAWSDFADVPMNPETEEIEQDFMHFPAGTNREEIWRWFDKNHSKGVAHLLYGKEDIKCSTDNEGVFLYAYDENGADVTTFHVIPGDDEFDAIASLFKYPETATVDVYDGGPSGYGTFMTTYDRDWYMQNYGRYEDDVYTVTSYYGYNNDPFTGTEDYTYTSDWSEVESWAHEHLMKGGNVRIEGPQGILEITADEYNTAWEDGAADFDINDEIVEYKNRIVNSAQSITCSDNSDLAVNLSDLELDEPHYEYRDDDPENPDKWVLVIGKNTTERKNYKLWYYIEDPDTDITTIDLSTPDHIDLDEMSTMDDYDEIQLSEDITAASRSGEVDPEAVRELVLVITNDGDLYRQRTTPMIENLKKKVAKGTYDREKAVKLWQYLADEGVRRYGKDYGPGYSVAWLSPATRRAIAEELRDYYEEEIMWDVNHADDANASTEITTI